MDTETWKKRHDEMCARYARFTKTIGNPEGQRRFYKFVCDGFGPQLLYGRLLPGKRKNFIMIMDFIVATHPWMNAPAEIDGQAWLCAMRRVTAGHGPRKDLDTYSYQVAWFSRHWIKRLAQRAHALTAADVGAIIWQTWANVALVERVMIFAVKEDETIFGSELLIPARVATLANPIVYAGSFERRGLVLKTVLDWSMLNVAQRVACLRLLDACAGCELLDGATRLAEMRELVAGVLNT